MYSYSTNDCAKPTPFTCDAQEANEAESVAVGGNNLPSTGNSNTVLATIQTAEQVSPLGFCLECSNDSMNTPGHVVNTPLYIMFVPRSDLEQASNSDSFNDLRSRSNSHLRSNSSASSNSQSNVNDLSSSDAVDSRDNASGISLAQASDHWVEVEINDLNEHSMVKLSRIVQTEGAVPGSGDTTLFEPKLDYFSRWLVGGRDVAIDRVNDDIDICFLPNRKGTRDPNAKSSCFMCDWEPDRVYWTRPESGIVFTNNVKPYTDQAHYLVGPEKHEPQEFTPAIFKECLSEVNQAAQRKRQLGETPRRSCLFAGPVGGSQPHQHWHLISKNLRVENCVNDPTNLKPLAIEGDGNNAIYHVQSRPLTLQTGVDADTTDAISFFNCILVRGEANFVTEWGQKIIDHMGEVPEGDELPRALYNLAIVPPDILGRSQLVIFPRSAAPEDSSVSNQLLWGTKSFNPSAHEMAGHWFMTDYPENPDRDNLDDAAFDDLLTHEIYRVTDKIRVPVESLELNSLFQELVTLHKSPMVAIKADLSTPEHVAAEWWGWSKIEVNPSNQPPIKPLLTSYSKPIGSQGVDTSYISPVLTQSQVNDVYDILEKTHDVLTSNNIPYFGGAGTLMGAIRHGGQMWNDDDGDLFVRRDDYASIEQLQPVFNAVGLNLQPGWPGFQVSKIGADTRADGTGVPFVDLCFMDRVLDENNQNQYVWSHIDSPQARGEASGPTFIHQMPDHVFDADARTEIKFGYSDDPQGSKGVVISVPKEKDSMAYLDRAYGKNWFDILKTRVHNHLEGTQSKSVALSIVNREHLARK